MDRKILLIEDDNVVRKNTAEILELANYQVETANNGKTGIEKTKLFKPDLIICDIMMPDLDGYGVLYLLSKNPTTANIPFIFLTAKAERSDMRKGMELGADDYITKPFDESELLNAIEIRLKKSEAFKGEYSANIEGLNNFIHEISKLGEFKNLSGNSKTIKYKKGDAIYYEGNHPTGLYFLISGMVKTFRLNYDGKEFIIGLFNEGDYFGYLSILENSAYTESAKALADSELYTIPKDNVLELIYKNRDVAFRFIKILSNNLIENENRLIQLAYDSVRGKTAQALLKLQSQLGKDKDIKITISREDLASITGTAMESLVRALAEFKEDKLIEINGRDIVILNFDGLKRIR